MTAAEAKAASDTLGMCAALEGCEGYQALLLPKLEELRQAHLDAGVDVRRSPQQRAEHHEAYLMAEGLLKFIREKREAAEKVLREWREQNGDSPGGYVG